VAQFTRLVKGLQALLPSSGTESHSVTELASTVTPVMRFPGRAVALSERIRTVQTASIAALTPTLDAITATFEEWIELLAGDISHDSATARNVQLELVDPVGFITFCGAWRNFITAQTPGQPSGFEPVFGHGGFTAASDRLNPQRPLIVPPGWILRFVGNTAGANYTLSVSLVAVRHPFPEDPITW